MSNLLKPALMLSPAKSAKASKIKPAKNRNRANKLFIEYPKAILRYLMKVWSPKAKNYYFAFGEALVALPDED